MKRILLISVLGVAACGGQVVDHDRCYEGPDSGDTICANPVFDSSALSASTRSLLLEVRELNGVGDDCDALFDTEPHGLAEARDVEAYPIVDGRYPGLPLDPSKYPRLVLLLYGLEEDATREVIDYVPTRPPIAGGCVVTDIPADVGEGGSRPSLRVDIPLRARP